jgi:3-hydroxyacyl-CoA dehydrogenase
MVALTDMVNYTVDDGVAVLTVNNPPVNALGHGVRLGLLKGVEKAQDDEAASAIVIYCEGNTFIAGADITEFATGPKDPQQEDVMVALENSSKPTVAAIHGTALGGGLETAMSCHYRVAVASAKCGLPEVNLGLLPGGGGTQRLPRLVGVEKALEMVTSGQPIGAPEANQLGLVDDIIAGDLRADAVAFAKDKAAQDAAHPRVRDNDEKLLAAREMPQMFDMARGMVAKRARGFIAPEYNIRCIEAAVNLPFDEGRKLETKLFMELVMGPQAQAQQYFFFAQRQASKIRYWQGSGRTTYQQSRRDRRWPDGWRHRHEYGQCGHSRDYRRHPTRVSGTRSGYYPQKLREHGQERPSQCRTGRNPLRPYSGHAGH